MTIQPKIRTTVLVAALATVAATAWAMNESTTAAEPPIVGSNEAAPMNDTAPAPTPAPAPAPSPSEEAAPAPSQAAPVVDHSVAQPPITVEQRRLSEDERIQSLVIDRLANTHNISGKIGVESHDSVVRLSGYTTTAGQAYRAGRVAGSIEGVKYVQNEIRPRMQSSI